MIDMIINHFENAWFARYPKPVSVIHIQGGEIMGYVFHYQLRVHNFTRRPTTAKNLDKFSQYTPSHRQWLKGAHWHASTSRNHLCGTVDRYCHCHVIFALSFTYHQTIPVGLAFGRDMKLNLLLITDL
jgi:hypothetical protein